MVPFQLLQSPAAATAIAIGFTFMAGFYGMAFLISIFLQERRGLTPFQSGLSFLPVTGMSFIYYLQLSSEQRFP